MARDDNDIAKSLSTCTYISDTSEVFKKEKKNDYSTRERESEVWNMRETVCVCVYVRNDKKKRKKKGSKSVNI